ncbi:MAG: KGG domain-containing protein [Gemmatimonadaceae bacterium]
MTGKSRRGFASMDPERQKEIASRGGRAAHEKGTAHEWSSDEARHAGRKGGVTVSRDRAHMAAIGREGGESRSAAARQTRQPKTAERELVLTVTREGGSATVSNNTMRPSTRTTDTNRSEPEIRTAM